MSEEEIFKTLEEACILDKNCYEVDCLLEKDLIAIRELIKLYKEQQKEIEEKTTILLAGAEKVKELEKGNRSLMESRIKWKDRYYKEKSKNKECISKDEVKEKIKELSKAQDFKVGLENYTIKILQELIGEK